jgi:hypothetical protein
MHPLADHDRLLEQAERCRKLAEAKASIPKDAQQLLELAKHYEFRANAVRKVSSKS